MRQTKELDDAKNKRRRFNSRQHTWWLTIKIKKKQKFSPLIVVSLAIFGPHSVIDRPGWVIGPRDVTHHGRGLVHVSRHTPNWEVKDSLCFCRCSDVVRLNMHVSYVFAHGQCMPTAVITRGKGVVASIVHSGGHLRGWAQTRS